MTEKIHKSRGNVFEDLGFPVGEAENLRIRARLMVELSKVIEERGLKQREAADLFGVTQPRVSDLLRGKIDRFSIDTLVNMLTRAQRHVDVRVRAVSGNRGR